MEAMLACFYIFKASMSKIIPQIFNSDTWTKQFLFFSLNEMSPGINNQLLKAEV